MAQRGYINSMLGEQEKVLLIARQHWFTVVSAILAEVVTILILLIIAAIAATMLPALAWLPLVLGALLVFIPLATLTYDLLAWWNRQYLVTTRRVIQISGSFNKNVVDSSLEKVNDVKMTQSVLGRLFDYGDVEILTASELGVNLFRRIENPIQFKTAMLNAKEKLERPNENDGRDSIPVMIAKLAELHQRGVLTDAEFQHKKAELLAKM
ncbi:MAG: PH domain-containing protein [Chloroflexota bacterium]